MKGGRLERALLDRHGVRCELFDLQEGYLALNLGTELRRRGMEFRQRDLHKPAMEFQYWLDIIL